MRGDTKHIAFSHMGFAHNRGSAMSHHQLKVFGHRIEKSVRVGCVRLGSTWNGKKISGLQCGVVSRFSAWYGHLKNIRACSKSDGRTWMNT